MINNAKENRNKTNKAKVESSTNISRKTSAKKKSISPINVRNVSKILPGTSNAKNKQTVPIQPDLEKLNNSTKKKSIPPINVRHVSKTLLGTYNAKNKQTVPIQSDLKKSSTSREKTSIEPHAQAASIRNQSMVSEVSTQLHDKATDNTGCMMYSNIVPLPTTCEQGTQTDMDSKAWDNMRDGFLNKICAQGKENIYVKLQIKSLERNYPKYIKT